MTYAAFHVDDHHTDGVIVAIGDDRDAVQAEAIRRVLTIGATFGEIQIQQRDDLADVAKETAAHLDAFFATAGAA